MREVRVIPLGVNRVDNRYIRCKTTAAHTMKYAVKCLAGVCGRPLLVELPDSRERVRLLLRTHISHHQASQQGHWSRGAWPGCYDGGNRG